MARKIGQITQADCYINEVDVCGRVAELDLGEIAHAEVEHQTLGMIGILKLPGRPVQAIEGKISFEWLDEGVSRTILMPTKVHRLQLHSYVDIFDGEGLNAEQSHTLVTHIGFQMMKTGGRTAKLGENLAQEHDISISTFKQSVYGGDTPIIEFDAWNNIYRINGEDVWPR
ncbi:phage tail protein [Brucella pseudogrignonensis]|uniref:Phage tail protein n=1 Tax=Brucella pseudogrignonensis TaxID=419475 RepID=A0A7Y3T817_9HYPH|nr:phage major tail tube protein [Brucella pseudogrignonensis]MCM0751187.1 phage tail protein [Brucella pseudogrignonensis]NNV22654.1 phage tail protein [Brucella pseudogrignonensis]